MKVFASVVLVVLFIPLFLVSLFSYTLKFDLLNYNFWQTTLEKNNVYADLTINIKSSFDNQIVKEGGNKNDIKVITDLITTENTKDTMNKNIKNVLDFVNGKTQQINIYLPLDKIPKDLIPESTLTKFNFEDYQNLHLENISKLGEESSYILVGSSALSLLILILLFVLTKEGERLIGMGLALIFSGGFTMLLVKVGGILSVELINRRVVSTSITSVILETISPPVIHEIILKWQAIGIVLVIVGIGLFFVKKPKYNVVK